MHYLTIDWVFITTILFAVSYCCNHYAWFGHATTTAVNIFGQLLGLEEVKWDKYVTTNNLGKDRI